MHCDGIVEVIAMKHLLSVAVAFGVVATMKSGTAAAATAAEVITLPDYAVWCTDVSVPRMIADNAADNAGAKQYYSLLAEGVTSIDKALGIGASTGTLFIARSANRVIDTKNGDANTAARTEVVVITVCAAAASEATVPSGKQVYREVRANEVVFAIACRMEDSGKCANNLQDSLVAKLGDSPLTKEVAGLFRRTVLCKTEATSGDDMRRLLTATDARPVNVAPKVVGTGDVVTAAMLTKPIEEQVARPLIRARPSWFNVVGQPQDKWVIIAISLTAEMAMALRP
jgi:hypothetical protein